MYEPYLLSTIYCEERGSLCEDLNPDKVSIVNRPWLKDPLDFFNKNEYGLEEEIKTLINVDKEECARIALDNNYAGFIYYGDKNKCYQYKAKANQFIFPIDKKLLNNNDIETFFRTKSTSSIDRDDQHNYYKYFTPVQTMDFVPEKYSSLDIVSDKINCMEKCVKNGKKCSSIMYGEQFKKCIFYNKKVMNNKKDNSEEAGDIYTVISNKLNQYHAKIAELNKKTHEDGDLTYCTKMNHRCAFDKVGDKSELNESTFKKFKSNSDIDIVNENNISLYNCNGLYSTNPFCTKQYTSKDSNNPELYYTDCFEIDIIKNKDEKKKFLTQLCKDKYGKEYVFNDDIYNMNSIIKCDDSTKKALCKIDFGGLTQPFVSDDKIEHFKNMNIQEEDDLKVTFYNANMFKIIVLLILIFLIGYLTYCIVKK